MKLFNQHIAGIIKQSKKDNATNVNPKTVDDASKKILSKLYALLINKPLQQELANKNSLIISPDGALRLLPFEALYNQDKKQYVIQQKDMRYIASGKEWLRLFQHHQKSIETSNAEPSNHYVVLFANPDFDADLTKKTPEPKKYAKNSARKSQQTLALANNHRGALPVDNSNDKSGACSLSVQKQQALPYTAFEAEAIIDRLQTRYARSYYAEKSATGANLLTIKQPTILHIATHGFFNNKPNCINPMLKSGLLMAGLNHSLDNDETEGIVSAL